jgi:methionyl aminopeptidase
MSEFSDYPSQLWRLEAQQCRDRESLEQDMLTEVREAAECHRTIRTRIRSQVKPGMTMIQIADLIENSTREILGDNSKNGRTRGIGFPTGLSLNHCAAHYTPNAGDKTVLKKDDVMKVDFGTHINGRIMDCAFTLTFNDKFTY